MKLIRKFNPKAAPYIPNPGGPNVFRMVALVKDGIFTHYVCFFDSWTGKIYIETVRMLHSGKFSYKDCWQISDPDGKDTEFKAVMTFLQSDEAMVLQEVETKYVKDEERFQRTGEVKFHEKLAELPLVKFGVDSNGSQIITEDFPKQFLQSPSEIVT